MSETATHCTYHGGMARLSCDIAEQISVRARPLINIFNVPGTLFAL